MKLRRSLVLEIHSFAIGLLIWIAVSQIVLHVSFYVGIIIVIALAMFKTMSIGRWIVSYFEIKRLKALRDIVFSEGEKSYHNGLTLDQCPYLEGAKDLMLIQAWMHGWWTAKVEFDLKKE